MLVRIASAAVGIPLAIIIVFGLYGDLFPLAIAALALIGLNEFYRGARQLGAQPHDWIGRLVCLILIAQAWGLQEGFGNVLPVALMFLFVAGLVVEVLRSDRAPIRNMGATVLGALYVGWLFSILVLLRFPKREISVFPPTGGWSTEWLDLKEFGAWLILYLLLTIWACDTGAYFTGRFFGRHKLAPSLSPGKTIEGLLGGLAGATMISVLTGSWLGFTMPQRIVLGVVLGLLSVLGDLTESAMKREIGIKDFGAIMPGHGGVLDRFDSLLLAAPALYLFTLIRH
jgi:phosphatidate cytidylyltransferase